MWWHRRALRSFSSPSLSLSKKLTIFLLISMSLSLFVHCRAKTNFFSFMISIQSSNEHPFFVVFTWYSWNCGILQSRGILLSISILGKRKMSIRMSICVSFQILLYIQPLLTSLGLSFTQLHDYSILLYSVLHLQHNAYNAASFMKRLLWPWIVLFYQLLWLCFWIVVLCLYRIWIYLVVWNTKNMNGIYHYHYYLYSWDFWYENKKLVLQYGVSGRIREGSQDGVSIVLFLFYTDLWYHQHDIDFIKQA